MSQILLVDIDDTVIPLLPTWLMLYNTDWNDNLIPSDIREWDLTKFVKCGNEIYKYLSIPTLYDNIEIPRLTQQAIKYLKIRGYKIVYISAGYHSGKYDLLKKYDLISSKKEIVFAEDKGLFSGNFMVDDKPENIYSFLKTNPKSKGILVDAPYNRKDLLLSRVYNWDNVIREIFKEL